MSAPARPENLVAREGKQGTLYYFKPTTAMRRAGYINEAYGTDYAKAVARINQINFEWKQERKAVSRLEVVRNAKAGTVAALIDTFQRDPTWYGQKHPRTREQMDRAFRIIEVTFGDIAVRSITRAHVRAFYNQQRIDGSVHKAKTTHKWFHRLLHYALELSKIDFNPASDMETETPDPRTAVWMPAEINAVIGACLEPATNKGIIIPQRPSMALAVTIAYDTSLPQQDIRALTWPQYDGEGLSVVQKKKRGNRDLYLPLSPEVRAMIDATPKQHACVVVNEETGLPYKDRVEFGKVFRKAKKRAGITRDLTFHDIRRTVLTELGNRGATNAEIVSMSGHSINSPVLKVYVRPDREAARRAVAKRRAQP